MENTRCTHGVLMWNLYLKSIIQDMNIPLLVKDEGLSRTIFEEVFYGTFLQIVETYLSISPARGRVLQYKIDVHFIVDIIDSWTSILSQSLQIKLYSIFSSFQFSLFSDLITYFLTAFTLIICPTEVAIEYLSTMVKRKKWDYNPSVELNKVTFQHKFFTRISGVSNHIYFCQPVGRILYMFGWEGIRSGSFLEERNCVEKKFCLCTQHQPDYQVHKAAARIP
jgi:hypothetical protein